MGENEILENGNHECISSVLKKAADPVLNPAAKRKLCANNFVLAKDEKHGTNCDSETRKRLGRIHHNSPTVEDGRIIRRFHSFQIYGVGVSNYLGRVIHRRCVEHLGSEPGLQRYVLT